MGVPRRKSRAGEKQAILQVLSVQQAIAPSCHPACELASERLGVHFVR
jgi:hypothetical protein